MLESNKQFEAFRDKLNARGVIMRCMWEASTGLHGQRKIDVALYSFSIVGESARFGTGPAEVDRLHVWTAIVVDYGKDGFGLWYGAPTNRIEDDVEYIIKGPRK